MSKLTDDELEALLECKFVSERDLKSNDDHPGPALLLCRYRGYNREFTDEFVRAVNDITETLRIWGDDRNTFYKWQRYHTPSEFVALIQMEIDKRRRLPPRGVLTRIIKGRGPD